MNLELEAMKLRFAEQEKSIKGLSIALTLAEERIENLEKQAVERGHAKYGVKDGLKCFMWNDK